MHPLSKFPLTADRAAVRPRGNGKSPAACHAARLRPAVVGAAVLLAALLAMLPALPPAAAQEGEADEEHIFRRFAQKPDPQKNDQLRLELPFFLSPQAEADAEIIVNEGFNLVFSTRPEGRFFFSQSLGYATTQWNPTRSDISLIEVTALDYSVIVNSVYRSLFVTSFGIGIGLMDGLLVYTDARNFETRLELFFPVQFGVALRVGESLEAGLKISYFPFFPASPMVSLGRLMVGLGYNF